MARIVFIGPTWQRRNALLGSLDHHQVVARISSAKSALRHLQVQQFDLLVVELALDDIHGLELVEILRQRNQLDPAIPVLIISHLDSALNIHRAAAWGAAGFLPMADCRARLQAVLDAIAQGNTVFPAYSRSTLEQDERLRCAQEFSTRQVAVVHGLSQGRTLSSLANLMSVTVSNVSYFKRKTMQALHAASQDEMIQLSQDIGLI